MVSVHCGMFCVADELVRAWCVMLQYLPMHCHWRLNERSYGALTGKNKKECVKIHGVDQVSGPCMLRRPTTHL